MVNNRVLSITKEWSDLDMSQCMRGRRSAGIKSIDDCLFSRRKTIPSTRQKNRCRIMPNRMTLFSLFLFLSFILLTCFLIQQSEASPKHHCLRHCHMCKKMYGRHFKQNLCAADCIESRGTFIPDCIDEDSIFEYLIF